MYTRNDYDTYLWNVITGDAEASLPLNIKAGFRFMGNIRNYHGEHKYSEGSVSYESYYGESQNHITDLTFQGRLTWSDTFVEDRLGVETACLNSSGRVHSGCVSDDIHLQCAKEV